MLHTLLWRWRRDALFALLDLNKKALGKSILPWVANGPAILRRAFGLGFEGPRRQMR